MKKTLIGAVLVGGAAFAIRRLAPGLHKLHSHCRDMMKEHCAREQCAT